MKQNYPTSEKASIIINECLMAIDNDNTIDSKYIMELFNCCSRTALRKMHQLYDMSFFQLPAFKITIWGGAFEFKKIKVEVKK